MGPRMREGMPPGPPSRRRAPRMVAGGPSWMLCTILLVATAGCRDVEVIAVLDHADDSEDEGGASDDTGTDPGWPTDLPDREPAACGAVGLAGPADVVLEVAPDSTWENGTCLTFTVRNESDNDVFWWQIVRLGGMLDTHWNSVSTAVEERTWEFRGIEDSSNVALLSGDSTTFGACMTCTPPP